MKTAPGLLDPALLIYADGGAIDLLVPANRWFTQRSQTLSAAQPEASNQGLVAADTPPLDII